MGKGGESLPIGVVADGVIGNLVESERGAGFGAVVVGVADGIGTLSPVYQVVGDRAVEVRAEGEFSGFGTEGGGDGAVGIGTAEVLGASGDDGNKNQHTDNKFNGGLTILAMFSVHDVYLLHDCRPHR